MSSKFDIKDVDAALQRAAKVATTGTREERSGRFTIGQAGGKAQTQAARAPDRKSPNAKP